MFPPLLPTACTICCPSVGGSTCPVSEFCRTCFRRLLLMRLNHSSSGVNGAFIGGGVIDSVSSVGAN